MIGIWWASFVAWAGKWLAIIGGAVVVLVTTALVFWRKGAKQQAGADAVKDAQAQVESARTAQQVTADAAQAAEQVRADAARQPPPDVAKRNDLDNTGFPP